MAKRQFSSLDLHYMIEELQILKDSKVDKIYQPEKNVFVFSFYKANEGKRLFHVEIGKCAYLTDEKEEGETLGFGMFLRKHIEGYFLVKIEQLKPERILKLKFTVKDEEKYLYVEMFSKGNLILCDKNNVILNCLEHLEFKDRSLKPKSDYKYPKSKYNLYDMKKTELEALLSTTAKDNLAACLAVELGLGGIYSEEVCLLSKISNDKKPKELTEKEIVLIFDSIKKIIQKKLEPVEYFGNDIVIDFSPFPLQFYDSKENKEFKAFSEAVSFFFSHFKEEKTTEHDKKINSLKRIIEEQEKSIENLRNEEKELREKGEFIYHKYSEIKEILDEINKANKKYSWKEIKEKLKNHKVIKDLSEKDRKIIVDIS